MNELGRLLSRIASFEQDLGPNLQILSASPGLEPNPTWPAIVHSLGEGEARRKLFGDLRRFYPEATAVRPVEPEGPPVTLKDVEADDRIRAILLPSLAPEVATASTASLRAIVHRLRAPGGCPWDREQTPGSLARFVSEEAAEVVDAIEEGDPAHLAEELGDLLLQVYLQAEIAAESGCFDLNDVVRQIGDKLIRRHPHVFEDRAVSGAAEVELNWEQLKAAERGPAGSALDGVPRALPALSRAHELQRRLVKAGFDWPDPADVRAKLEEELAELHQATGDREATAFELGDVLFMLVRLGLDAGVDAEAALREATRRVELRYRWIERESAKLGQPASTLPISKLLDLWQRAKLAERPST